jgi:hypothetical protein
VKIEIKVKPKVILKVGSLLRLSEVKSISFSGYYHGSLLKWKTCQYSSFFVELRCGNFDILGVQDCQTDRQKRFILHPFKVVFLIFLS